MFSAFLSFFFLSFFFSYSLILFFLSLVSFQNIFFPLSLPLFFVYLLLLLVIVSFSLFIVCYSFSLFSVLYLLLACFCCCCWDLLHVPICFLFVWTCFVFSCRQLYNSLHDWVLILTSQKECAPTNGEKTIKSHLQQKSPNNPQESLFEHILQ